MTTITRRLLLGRALTGAAALASGAAIAAPYPGNIAMWVWNDRVLDPGELPSFVARRSVGAVYLYATPDAAERLLSGDAEALSSVKALRASGCDIYPMAGEPDWATGVAKVPEHAALLLRLARNRDLFAGLHFDVEPNALPEWRSQRDRIALAHGTLAFYDLLREAAPAVLIDAAVNPFFATMQLPNENFMAGLAKRVGSVSIMAYRNSVPKTLAWAKPAVEQVLLARRQWRLGVLTEANPAEPGTSWFGTDPETFGAAMSNLDEKARSELRGYNGLVFQEYESLSGLVG